MMNRPPLSLHSSILDAVTEYYESPDIAYSLQSELSDGFGQDLRNDANYEERDGLYAQLVAIYSVCCSYHINRSGCREH